METFGSRIKKIRERKGLSLKDTAAKARVPLTTYREWEYGREIRGEPYVKIAEALDVTLYELLTGNEPLPLQVSEKFHAIEKGLKELRRELESFL